MTNKHYSEQILETLINDFGWKKELTGFISKEYQDLSKAGEVNPKGIFKIYADFCERSRYLTAYSGFDVLFDVDGREENAAKLFQEKFNNLFRA